MMLLKHQWTSKRTIAARYMLISLIVAVMVAWFIGGIFLYPDAPIHACNQENKYFYLNHPFGYCGKQGQSHTEVDFRRFEFWQIILFCLWPSGMGAVAILGRGLPTKAP